MKAKEIAAICKADVERNAAERRLEEEQDLLVLPDEQRMYADDDPSEFTPVVGIHYNYTGSESDYVLLARRINKYLAAKIPHTFVGLALYLRCDPDRLRKIEAGEFDKQHINHKVSDLLRTFRLAIEDEWYKELPVKQEKDVERLVGKSADKVQQQAAERAAVEKYAG